jgi:hypothetical protein
VRIVDPQCLRHKGVYGDTPLNARLARSYLVELMDRARIA